MSISQNQPFQQSNRHHHRFLASPQIWEMVGPGYCVLESEQWRSTRMFFRVLLWCGNDVTSYAGNLAAENLLFPRNLFCFIDQIRHHYREIRQVSFIDILFFKLLYNTDELRLWSLQRVCGLPFYHLVLLYEVVQGREDGRVLNADDTVSTTRASGPATYSIAASWMLSWTLICSNLFSMSRIFSHFTMLLNACRQLSHLRWGLFTFKSSRISRSSSASSLHQAASS